MCYWSTDLAIVDIRRISFCVSKDRHAFCNSYVISKHENGNFHFNSMNNVINTHLSPPLHIAKPHLCLVRCTCRTIDWVWIVTEAVVLM